MHHAKMPAGHLVNQRKRWSSEINVTELIEISSSEVFFFYQNNNRVGFHRCVV